VSPVVNKFPSAIADELLASGLAVAKLFVGVSVVTSVAARLVTAQ